MMIVVELAMVVVVLLDVIVVVLFGIDDSGGVGLAGGSVLY